MGMVPGGFWFSGTVRENLSFWPRETTDSQVREAACAAGAPTTSSRRRSTAGEPPRPVRARAQLVAEGQLVAFARAPVAIWHLVPQLGSFLFFSFRPRPTSDAHTEEPDRGGPAGLVAVVSTSIVIAHRLSTICTAGRDSRRGGGTRDRQQGTHQELLTWALGIELARITGLSRPGGVMAITVCAWPLTVTWMCGSSEPDRAG